MKLDKIYKVSDLPESDDSYSLLPEGVYQAEIDSAELKTTKAGNGQYIKLTFRVLGPTHVNRLVFSNLNISNPSETAQRIGLEQLSALLKAIGLPSISDTDNLLGGVCNIKVTIKRQPDTQYQDSNEIKKYLPVTTSTGPTKFPPTAKYDTVPWN